MVSTLTSVTEIPEGDFVKHPDEILRRVTAGEDLVVTVDGRPAVDLSPHRPAVGLEEFLSWPKADRSLLDDIREIRGGDTTDDIQDPWKRWA
jgi:antitoxin (DNA-binding transcriptional repressor) of toxin-antitoxin stability system